MTVQSVIEVIIMQCFKGLAQTASEKMLTLKFLNRQEMHRLSPLNISLKLLKALCAWPACTQWLPLILTHTKVSLKSFKFNIMNTGTTSTTTATGWDKQRAGSAWLTHATLHVKKELKCSLKNAMVKLKVWVGFHGKSIRKKIFSN